MFEELVSSPSLAGSPPPPPPPGDVGAHIVKTFLELDVRHKADYITVFYDESEGKWCWTCLCQNQMKSPFVWYGRKRMEKHVEGQAHIAFLENPNAYIFVPQQLWIENQLDPRHVGTRGVEQFQGNLYVLWREFLERCCQFS